MKEDFEKLSDVEVALRVASDETDVEFLSWAFRHRQEVFARANRVCWQLYDFGDLNIVLPDF